MLVILFAASCILAVSGQLAGPSQQMPINLAGIMVPLGQGRMMDLGTVQKPTVEAICNAAVFANKGRVTDAMSDTMGQAISKMMKAIPSFGANPMAMAGTSPKWQCLFQANAGNTAGGISDYFDTVPEITKFVPFFNPCDTVFCGEQGMTPSAIAGAVAASFRRASMGMGPVSQRWLSLFGNQRSKVPSQYTTPRGGMFGPKPPMGGMGSGGANPFMAALGRGMGSGMGGGMGGMGSSGGLAGMMKMAQQVMGGMANMGGMKNPMSTMTQPLNPAQPSSINSAAATNTNPTPNPSPSPAQTGISVPANNAASLPPSSSSSSSTPSATPSNAFSNLSPKAITGNPFASMPNAATMSRMMQQMQQLKNQLMGVSMGAANTPQKPAATPTNTGMPNMGMKSPGVGMTGMPGMGMPGMGMGAPNMGMGMGMPGMGGMAALMQAAVMGEMMADAPDPVQPRMGMGRGMSGMPFGMGGSMPMMGGQMPFMGQQMPMMGQQMPMMGGSMGFPFGGGATGMMGGGFNPFGFNPFGSF